MPQEQLDMKPFARLLNPADTKVVTKSLQTQHLQSACVDAAIVSGCEHGFMLLTADPFSSG